MNKLKLSLIILLLPMLLGCGLVESLKELTRIPFDVTTDEFVANVNNIQNSYYEEQLITPQELQNDQVIIDEISLIYTLINDSDKTMEVKIYLSKLDYANLSGEMVLSTSVPPKKSVTSTISPAILKELVKQEKFYIGVVCKNMDNLTIKAKVRVKGSYQIIK